MKTTIETIGDATLYLGDCMDILPTLDKIDAVITDPPYGLGDRMKGGTWAEKQEFKDMVVWDTAPPSIEDLLNIASKAKICVFWGGNYYGLPASRCWLVWDKQNAVPTMSDCEIAWTNLDANTKRFSHPVGRVLNGHPSEKPLRLMEWTLQTVKASGVILDPFMGSGTTGVASIKSNNKFIGIEREQKYFDIACKRIEQASKQVDMFIQPMTQTQESLIP
jgi:site-specific DNA-methyltransferase (adenine-specific)/modification methylase